MQFGRNKTSPMSTSLFGLQYLVWEGNFDDAAVDNLRPKVVDDCDSSLKVFPSSALLSLKLQSAASSHSQMRQDTLRRFMKMQLRTHAKLTRAAADQRVRCQQ